MGSLGQVRIRKSVFKIHWLIHLICSLSAYYMNNFCLNRLTNIVIFLSLVIHLTLHFTVDWLHIMYSFQSSVPDLHEISFVVHSSWHADTGLPSAYCKITNVVRSIIILSRTEDTIFHQKRKSAFKWSCANIWMVFERLLYAKIRVSSARFCSIWNDLWNYWLLQENNIFPFTWSNWSF